MPVSVVIVDDEPMVIESIRWGVDFEALHAEVCAAFTDSREALEYIRENPVDIVITDIDMPPFSGLVLCSRILELGSGTQLIIISGYADFSYAQKCIAYGALGYCLKPIDYDDLTACVKKAVGNINNGNGMAVQEFIEALYEGNKQALRGYLDEGHINETFYIAVSVSKGPVFCCYAQNIGLNEYLYLSNEPIPALDKEWLAGNPDIFGVSRSAEMVSCKELQQKACQLVYNSYQFFFYEKEKEFTENTVYDSQVMQKARAFLACPEELECLLLDGAGMNHIRMAADLYNLALQYMDEESCLYSYNQIVYRFKNFKGLAAYIVKERRGENEPETEYESGNRKFLELIKFVNANYSPDISAQSLAGKLNLNPCYFSQLFKKETGTTFVIYLTELRISRAKELMLKTDMSVNEIGEACGFHDYFYFIKIFKKFTGKAPTVFRQER